ncbi:MAG TPA: hypothetical protein VGK29_10860 [Paludibaculum sp.]|jgi:hypothetical protein
MKYKLTCRTLLIIPVLLAGAASGQTSYYPYDQLNKPTPADLMVYGGRAKSVMVQVLNLTPYTIRFTTPAPYNVNGVAVSHLGDVTNRNRETEKSFLFAPVGVPRVMAPVPVQTFPDLPGFDANYVNSSTRPYSMVFAWDDRNAFVKQSSVFWTIEGVRYYKCNGCPTLTADVPLGLFMSRIAPEGSLRTGFLPVLVDVVKEAATFAKIAINPLNPLSWVKAFMGIKELADDAAFAQRQQQSDEEGKMYMSAYAIPDIATTCYANISTSGCVPSAHYNDDAADAQWGYALGGYAAQEIMVTTHIIRGKRAEQSWVENIDGRRGSLGELGMVMITVMRSQDYVAAFAAHLANTPLARAGTPENLRLTPDVRANVQQLRHLLEKHGLSGADALRVILGRLDTAERQHVSSILHTLRSGGALTNAERQYLHRLIVDLRHALNEKEEA